MGKKDLGSRSRDDKKTRMFGKVSRRRVKVGAEHRRGGNTWKAAGDMGGVRTDRLASGGLDAGNMV